MVCSLATEIRRLFQDKGGNVLPLAVMGMLLAAAVVGGAIDFSRYFRVQNNLQAACDAGVLAGRRAVGTDGYDQSAQDEADKFFNVNFTLPGDGNFTSSSDDDGNNVEGTASYTLDTAVMRLFGFKTFDLTANCSASMGVGNADVMMVLDTTGSMSSTLSGTNTTRISALRSAMKNFYTTLSGAMTGSNARVRYGFVPYSSTVNVGHLLYNLNPDYIVDSHSYQSREPFYIDLTDATYEGESTSYSSAQDVSSSYYSGTYDSQTACATALASLSATDWTDYGSSSTGSANTGSSTSSGVTVTQDTTQEQRRTTYACETSSSGGGGKGGRNKTTSYYIAQVTQRRTATTTATYEASYTNTPTSNSTFDHWEYKSVDYDTSTFKTFSPTTTYTGSDGASASSTWDGCIEERGTEAASSFSYSSLTGYSPSDALDIDIDTVPDADDDTKWAPLWPQILYTRSGTSTTSGYSLATSETGSKSSITEYCPQQAQGLEEMTQDDFDTYADSLTAVGGTYLDSGMIWGGRLLSPDGIFSDLVNEAPSNGGEVSRHIVFMTDGQMETYNYVYSAWGLEWFDRRVTDDGSSDNTARHTSRFLAVCNAIKAKGIRIWVVAFTSGLSDDLKSCASDDSSFTASNGTELNDAFQEIAKEVGELRIVQ